MFVDGTFSYPSGSTTTVIAYSPAAPIELATNVGFNLTLTFNRPVLAYLRLPDLSESMMTNLTMHYQVYSVDSNDYATVTAAKTRWPNFRYADSDKSWTRHPAIGRYVTDLKPCLIDATNKVIYFWINFEKSPNRYSYSAAAAGSLQVDVYLKFEYQSVVPVSAVSGQTINPTGGWSVCVCRTSFSCWSYT